MILESGREEIISNPAPGGSTENPAAGTSGRLRSRMIAAAGGNVT